MQRSLILVFFFTCLTLGLFAQEVVYQSFKDTRIVNTHSIETLKAGMMDFRVGHRFGDIAGESGGWKTLYGLENAADVAIGFDYGLTDEWMIGINRAKGAGPLRQNVNTFTKFRLMQQEEGGNKPFSITVLAAGTVSTQAKTPTQGSLSSFDKGAHRLSYHLQVLFARKFSPYFSIQGGGGWTYRNIVPFNDVNDLVSISLSSRINFTKALGVVLDFNYPISELRTIENGYYPILGIGLEWETGGGHVFLINLTNAEGINETDYLPYTRTNWLDGEYRLGFTIARLFKL
ncbi:DUF5777 family beta-barrel protein [Saprospiraceae bacterium]|jgi:hypothetical protein|nr:hypothetical protein [Saprospiraceae bacterium]MDC1508078.1 DUF5777 family beta-barrel protein [Saprospiraceae bacterium]HAV28354.1 hypothetical protein [Saprospirales bacterium]HAW04385.1 hypothetical protein [Saprospirales bacterium]